ncbi:MAG: hypothetical protein HG467_000140 [Clostridiales bacterium]|nr:hypothetical protein [Clostridiales bacterium]
MNKQELNDFLNNELEKNKVVHSYLFYGEKIEEFKEEILLFLNEVGVNNFNSQLKKINSDIDNLNLDVNTDLINECEELKNRIAKIKKNIKDVIINDFKILNGLEMKVDDVRKAFENIYEKPFLLDKKIYFIENFEYLNINSQNAMLKILEEPPHFIVIVLLSKNTNNILDTIKSRCLKIYLNEKENIEDDNSLLIMNEDIEENKFNIYRDIFKDVKRMPKSIYYSKYNKIINKDDIKELIVYLEKLIAYNIEEYYIYTNVIKKVKQKALGNLNFEMLKDYLILNIYEANK